jgi:hypothetical protein
VLYTRNKKDLILEYGRAQGLGRVGLREIRAVEAELRRHYGPNERTAASYIANVLQEAGAEVHYHNRFVNPWMEEPYASRLEGVLEFRDIASAEASLRKLDAIYREYRELSDRVGTSLVRELALKGKQRAESLASNPRVSPEKRREKKEIAGWFRVWLEISDLFFDWLELRKQSEEFRHTFPGRDGNHGSSAPSA